MQKKKNLPCVYPESGGPTIREGAPDTTAAKQSNIRNAVLILWFLCSTALYTSLFSFVRIFRVCVNSDNVIDIIKVS